MLYCMIFYFWVILQLLSSKHSHPARTINRRFWSFAPLVHIDFSPSSHLYCVFWERKPANTSLVKDYEPKHDLQPSPQPLAFAFSLRKYNPSCNHLWSTLFYSKKITAPCGAANFLRWLSQTLDIYVPVRVSTRIVSPSLTNSGTWSV